MEDFDVLLKQAVSIKSSQAAAKKKFFDSLPLFLKCGLYYSEKYASVRVQGFFQRLCVCELLKNEGNRLFKEQKYDKAARTYEQAQSIFRYILNRKGNWRNDGIVDDDLDHIRFQPDEEQDKRLVDNILLTLYLNLAATYLKLADFPNSIAACDEVLKADPQNVKALYRRAKARTSSINVTMADYEAGLQDLREAVIHDPNDNLVITELERIKRELSKYKKQDEAICKEIFKKKNEVTSTPAELSKDQKKEPEVKESKKTIGPELSLAKLNSTSTRSRESFEKTPLEELGLDEDYDYGSDGEGLSLANLSKKVSKEIEELGKFLERRGSEIVNLYESTGRFKEADDLKEKLKKAMIAKKRMEKMSNMDFEKPTEQMSEMAKQFGLDLNDENTKAELLKMQAQQIRDIRNMIEGKDSSKESAKGESRKKSPKKTSNGNNTTSNVVINNNFINTTINNSTQIVSNIIKTNESNKVLCDLLTNMNKRSEEEKSLNNVSRIMNLVIIVLAMVLFIITLLLHSFNK